MVWSNPILYNLIPTTDSESFRYFNGGDTGLPLPPHLGAFGVKRKYHIHEGVDLYVPKNTSVFAVEDGIVTQVAPFTGPSVGSEWWNETQAVWIEGESGVVVYGEIDPSVVLGQFVKAGERIGSVLQVLVKDKGRPMSMLHMELHSHGTTESLDWIDDKPDTLQDPTPKLLEILSNNVKEVSNVKSG